MAYLPSNGNYRKEFTLAILHLHHNNKMVLVSYPEGVIRGVSCGLGTLGNVSELTKKRAASPLEYAFLSIFNANFGSTYLYKLILVRRWYYHLFICRVRDFLHFLLSNGKNHC